MAGGKINAGVFEQGGARFGQWANNLAIVRATTTNAGDSIKITSADGTALSATNYGWVTLPSVATAGGLTTFSLTSDVTILLTGAHWQPSSGSGTTDDITGAILRVLAINSNGSLVWGVAQLGGRQTLLSTDASATQASITLPEHILTSAAVNATNTCREIGYFRADYDDTGGAASKLWAVQSGINDVVTGQSADGLYQPWKPSVTGYAGTVPASSTAIWTQIGREISVIHSEAASTSTGTGFTITGPAKALDSTTTFLLTQTQDNGVDLTSPGFAQTTAGSTTLTLLKDMASGNWTAANGKRAWFNGTYPVGPAASFLE